MDLKPEQELKQVNQRLSHHNAVSTRVLWSVVFCLVVCFVALVMKHFLVSSIAFIATILCIVFWLRLLMQHLQPLQRKAGSLRNLLNHMAEAPTKIEPRCDEDAEVDASKWRDYMSNPYNAYWLPNETPSLQPGDVVLYFCSVGYPNFGGITRYKIERHGRVVAQFTTIHPAPFNMGK